ncbi:helix-turn-helix domain-containing protein [Pedobacter sp. Leaf216]|uniref:helix-turn-helix domain-containing protein n=1 Tax=Pedobacter sp. Leaf216 TaxID=1735684 RepID=UPI000A75751F|nr:helix-turn-helix domain-containing protein [Pedobacter sp. Leaf216]
MLENLEYINADSQDIEHVLNVMNTVHPIDNELAGEFKKHLLKLKIKKDQILFKENEVCQYMYYIVKGALMGCTTHNKQKITTYISVENDFVSSISGLHGSAHSQEYAVAVEDSELLAMHNGELNRLFKHHFELNYIFRVVLEKYYKDAQQRAHIIRVGNAKERYLYFAQTNPNYLDRLPAEIVASLLNIKPSTLSAIKKNYAVPKKQSLELEKYGKQFENYVVNNQSFRNKGIRLNTLAEDLGLSSHKLSTVLNCYFNQSFIDYINQQRVNWIKDSLRNQDIIQSFTLEALAYSAGFSSRSAFYNSFKKIVGMSPLEYAKKLRSVKTLP